MWNHNSLDKLARQFQQTDELKDHLDEKSSIKDELNNPSRYGKKEAWSEGGMKQIYQIYDHSTGRHLAMAELKPDLEQDFTEPFLREARLTAALDHPNIISIHEIGLHDDGSPYFTMDFLSNRTLQQLFYEHREKAKANDPQQLLFERLDIFLKICDAISYAHSRGIVHLDIKLSNVHIGVFGEVWVCDWGLGKSLEEPEIKTEVFEPNAKPTKDLQEIWTRQYGIKGTPGSIAPEQIRGYHNANKKSDIYSLGSILYELVLLEKPFSGNEKEVLDKIQKGAWKFNSTPYLPSVPVSLKAVISKAMSLNELDRYTDVNEFKKDIELYLGGHATKAQRAGLWLEFALFIKRHQWPSAIAFSLIIIIVILTSTFVNKLKDSTQKAQQSARLAEEQSEIAKQSKQRAEYVAEQYQKEKKIFDDHQKRMSNHDRSYHDILLSGLIFKDSRKSVDLALRRLNSISKDSPNYNWALEKLVYAYFLKQDFKNAIDAYHELTEKSAIEIQKDLYETSLAFQDNLGLNGLLNLKDFAKMLSFLKDHRTMKRTHLIEKMLSYDHEIRGKSPYFDVIKVILEHWHEDWDGTGFLLDENTQTIHISSPELRMFTYITISSDRCILRFLEFDHIILSGSGVYDLSHFDDLNLSSMDLTNTKINSIIPLNQFNGLDEAIITKGQFETRQIKKVQKNIKIIYK